MKTYLSIFLFFLTSYSFGQNMFETKLDNCNANAFFLEGNEIFAKKDISVLLTEILSNIDSTKIAKLIGEINIQIFVDEYGNVCCISMENNLNKVGKKIDFPKIIKNSTKWSPPIREGKITSICTIVKLVFSNDNIIIQRQGFNRKLGGFIVLASSEQKKIKNWC